MFDREAVESMAAARGINVAALCYQLGEYKPWGLGYMFWLADRWADVAEPMGMTYESIQPVRELFVSQFVDACVQRLQKQMGPNREGPR